jgi:chemotaxis protein CheD
MRRNKSDFHALPEGGREVYLQPGDWFWGEDRVRIKTLLGSCVAICVWHPRLKVGGMTHCLLPTRDFLAAKGDAAASVTDSELSGRYVDEALEIFFRQMRRAGTRPQDFVVKVFGGGKMFEFVDKTGITVGERNLQMMRTILEREGMEIAAQHVGGTGHRHVIFELWSGDCWVRHEELPG